MHILKQLYQINSKSGNEKEIKTFIINYLKSFNLKITEDFFGNLFITKGVSSSYPCVAAHLDEVHLPSERCINIDNDKIYALDNENNSVGIGADDKNGIWIALNLLKEKPILKVAFFVQEEKDGDKSGCRGSNACDLTFFDDCEFVIECDRKGNSDFVTIGKGISLCEGDFIPEIILRKYGYSPVEGGKTDVVALKMRGLPIPCCNLSCGYYNAHKFEEYTLFSELQNCLRMLSDIIDRYS